MTAEEDEGEQDQEREREVGRGASVTEVRLAVALHTVVPAGKAPTDIDLLLGRVTVQRDLPLQLESEAGHCHHVKSVNIKIT